MLCISLTPLAICFSSSSFYCYLLLTTSSFAISDPVIFTHTIPAQQPHSLPLHAHSRHTWQTQIFVTLLVSLVVRSSDSTTATHSFDVILSIMNYIP